MSIFFSAGFLQQGTVEDRQNRVMEILLSSVTAEQLLVGKLLGLGAAGLLQVGLYVVLVIIPGTTVLSFFDVPLGGVAALARLLRVRLHAVRLPDGRLRDDRTDAAGDGAALGALDARRGEPDVVHHGDHRGAERAHSPGSSRSFR